LEAVDLIAQWDGQATLGELQDRSQVTKAPRLQKADAEIDWSRTAREIDCHVRGMQPWPVAFTHLPMPGGKPPLRLAIKEIKILPDASESAAAGELLPGAIVPAANLVVATADRLVEVVRLQPAGKREMTGQEFLCGHQPTEGTRLGSV
jgi:methionyl-tRNA formyltransferase